MLLNNFVLSCFQLSSLSRHAEDLFGEMIAESTSILNRTVSLQGRVDKLSVKVKNLDSNVEEGNGTSLIQKPILFAFVQISRFVTIPKSVNMSIICIFLCDCIA